MCPAWSPEPEARGPLQEPLGAFAPPHHQGGHEQGDQHGDGDEGGQDAGGRVVEQPAGGGAVVEVGPVDLREEAVDDVVGPETVHPEGHVGGAVRQSLVDPAEGDNTQPYLND